MKVNIGNIERAVRVAVGFGLVVWALTGGPVWAWIGIVPIVTGVIGNCPAYSIFGISTCSAKK
jgi:hypothetical protein